MFPKNVAIGIRNPATDKAGVDYDLATVINTVVHRESLLLLGGIRRWHRHHVRKVIQMAWAASAAC